MEHDDGDEREHLDDDDLLGDGERPWNLFDVVEDEIGQRWEVLGIWQAFVDDGDNKRAEVHGAESEQARAQRLLPIGSDRANKTTTSERLIFDLVGRRAVRVE